MWDGQQWARGSEADTKDVLTNGKPSLVCRFKGGNADAAKRQDNYLDRDGKPVAYLRCVFRPNALCEDATGGVLWCQGAGKTGHSGAGAVRPLWGHRDAHYLPQPAPQRVV